MDSIWTGIIILALVFVFYVHKKKVRELRELERRGDIGNLGEKPKQGGFDGN